MLSQSEIKDECPSNFKFHHFRGVTEAGKVINQMKEPVLVYFDPDIDGGFAGVLSCKYLTMIGKTYTWCCNSRREHGWKLDLGAIRGKDILAVDFLISKDTIKEICDSGSNIVSFDHHENDVEQIYYVSETGCKGIVINNQYPFEDKSSRYLSGAGVAFESFIEMLPEFNTLLNRAIVGITLLSDIRDIENPYARRYLYELYHHKYTGYIKYLIDAVIPGYDYGFGVPRMDRNFVDYRFSPKLNACFRFNEEQEVINFLLEDGFLDLECHKLQKELVSLLKEKSKVVELSNLRIVSFFVKDFLKYKDVLASFVGLTASRFLDDTHSCICMAIGNGYVERASFRGRINGLGYLSAVSNLIHGEGHGSAFGIKELVPSSSLFKKINKACLDLEKEVNWERKIVRTANLSIFSRRKGKKYAIENQYCLSQNRTYVKYTGYCVEKKRSTSDVQEYYVDGISVLCFDSSVDISSGLIFPILERGNLTYYLE